MSENLHNTAGHASRAEASCLYRLLGQDGSTLEELRSLISVPPKTERALRTFAQAHPENARWIEAVLNFRVAVAEEFERLVRDGLLAAAIPELEELEGMGLQSQEERECPCR